MVLGWWCPARDGAAIGSGASDVGATGPRRGSHRRRLRALARRLHPRGGCRGTARVRRDRDGHGAVRRSRGRGCGPHQLLGRRLEGGVLGRHPHGLGHQRYGAGRAPRPGRRWGVAGLRRLGPHAAHRRLRRDAARLGPQWGARLPAVRRRGDDRRGPREVLAGRAARAPGARRPGPEVRHPGRRHRAGVAGRRRAPGLHELARRCVEPGRLARDRPDRRRRGGRVGQHHVRRGRASRAPRG